MGKVYLHPTAPNCCAAAANELGWLSSEPELGNVSSPAHSQQLPQPGLQHTGASLTGVPPNPPSMQRQQGKHLHKVQETNGKENSKGNYSTTCSEMQFLPEWSGQAQVRKDS